MTKANGCETVSRREAIRLVAATPAAGAMLASSLPAALAGRSITGADAAGVAQAGAHAPTGLAKLSAEHFEPLVGERFTVGDDTLTLSDVRRGLKSRAGFRQQFALTFNALRDVPAPTDVLPVSHPAIGRHDLLVTQINGPVGTALEICFS